MCQITHSSGVFVILILWFASNVEQATCTSNIYYITPTTSQALCPDVGPCMTLSQYTVLGYHTNDTVLFFLPGNHSLQRQIIFESLVNVSLSGVPESSIITCTNQSMSGVVFNAVSNIRIHNLIFRGCAGSSIRGAVQFTNGTNVSIVNSGFFGNGKNEHEGFDGGALFVETCSSVFISECHFERNLATDGGAVYAAASVILITNSYFTSNRAQFFGGAIFSAYGQLNIQNCQFTDNGAGVSGGVLSAHNSKLYISGCILNRNRAEAYGGSMYITASEICPLCSAIIATSNVSNCSARSGGALTIQGGRAYISDCLFTRSNATVSGGVLYVVQSSVSMAGCRLEHNKALPRNGKSALNTSNGIQTANYGGGLYIGSRCDVSINNTHFEDNHVQGYGGGVFVGITSNLSVWNTKFDRNYNGLPLRTEYESYGGAVCVAGNLMLFVNCSFHGNEAVNGGAIYNYFAKSIIIMTCMFENNIALKFGGALSTCERCVSRIDSSYFVSNHADRGGAIFAHGSFITSNAYLRFENNSCNSVAVVYLHHCEVTLSGGGLFKNNIGGLFVFVTKVSFKNETIFVNNSQPLDLLNRTLSAGVPSGIRHDQGGSMTLIQSDIMFQGNIIVSHSRAKYGGGILSSESTLYAVIGSSVVLHKNTALVSGGALYTYQSKLLVGSNVSITDNVAGQNGGGVMATGSTIRVVTGQFFVSRNEANKSGGGMYLEENSRLVIEKNIPQVVPLNFLYFSKNTADFGGALYVKDDANSGICVGESAISEHGQCFFQVIGLYPTSQLTKNTDIKSTTFSNNTGRVRGSSLYGGLLDRCTISPFAEVQIVFPDVLFKDSFTALNLTARLDAEYAVSSDAVRVCFCEHNEYNCDINHSVIQVRKGETFQLSLVAVDQIGNSMGANIIASVSHLAGVREGQTNQTTLGECTVVEYNVFSPNMYEEMALYADGPCSNKGISQRSINISFQPCDCLIGFQPGDSNSTCECICDVHLSPFITNCSLSNETLYKNGDYWISYTNETTVDGFIIYDHCPYDYCRNAHKETVPVNLNLPNGADEQCDYNRSGILCGSCSGNLSLLFGSSRCLECTNSYIALLIPFALAGVMLIVFLLVFNITVATGTINGLVFYGNIVAANPAIFLPFEMPNVLSIFVAWLNLDLGIETCFYNGMDTYAKNLLQIVFPTYVLFLVVMIIVFTEHSKKLSKLLSQRNPVATLATLILLSYTKFLRVIIVGLSFGHLKLPDGSEELVWLPDANVSFFTPGHIPRIIIAILIIFIGLVFTGLLLFEKCLRKCSNRKPFKCLNNTKLHAFMDAYYAPLNPQHCYWVGLLLLARTTLYLHSIGFNSDVTLEQKAYLLAVIGTVFFLIIIKQWKVRIYKNWTVDLLETSFLINLGVFAAGTYHILSTSGNKAAVAYVSLSVAFTTFIAICVYHLYTCVQTPLREQCTEALRQRLIHQTTDETSEFHEELVNSDTNKSCSDEPYNKLQTGYCELREPALDVLCPVTPKDHLLKCRKDKKVPQLNIAVTTSVIERPGHK